MGGKYMKSSRGQNVRLVVSCCRFVVSSFLCVTQLLHSVFSSTNFLNFAVSSCHFVASSCHLVTSVSSFPCFDLPLDSSSRLFDVSFRRFGSAYLTVLELHDVVDSLSNVANLPRAEEQSSFIFPGGLGQALVLARKRG